jgi:hypothetical protein
MVDAVDPLTGENAGSANEWTHILDYIAQAPRPPQVVQRRHRGQGHAPAIPDWVESSKLGTAEYKPSPRPERIGRAFSPRPQDPAQKPFQANFERSWDPKPFASSPGSRVRSRLRAVRRTPGASRLAARSVLMTPHNCKRRHGPESAPWSGIPTRGRASPLRGMSLQFRARQRHARHLARPEGACMVGSRANAWPVCPHGEPPHPPIDKNDAITPRRTLPAKAIHQWVRSEMHPVSSRTARPLDGARHLHGTWTR